MKTPNNIEPLTYTDDTISPYRKDDIRFCKEEFHALSSLLNMLQNDYGPISSGSPCILNITRATFEHIFFSIYDSNKPILYDEQLALNVSSKQRLRTKAGSQDWNNFMSNLINITPKTTDVPDPSTIPSPHLNKSDRRSNNRRAIRKKRRRAATVIQRIWKQYALRIILRDIQDPTCSHKTSPPRHVEATSNPLGETTPQDSFAMDADPFDTENAPYPPFTASDDRRDPYVRRKTYGSQYYVFDHEETYTLPLPDPEPPPWDNGHNQPTSSTIHTGDIEEPCAWMNSHQSKSRSKVGKATLLSDSPLSHLGSLKSAPPGSNVFGSDIRLALYAFHLLMQPSRSNARPSSRAAFCACFTTMLFIASIQSSGPIVKPLPLLTTAFNMEMAAQTKSGSPDCKLEYIAQPPPSGMPPTLDALKGFSIYPILPKAAAATSLLPDEHISAKEAIILSSRSFVLPEAMYIRTNADAASLYDTTEVFTAASTSAIAFPSDDMFRITDIGVRVTHHWPIATSLDTLRYGEQQDLAGRKLPILISLETARTGGPAPRHDSRAITIHPQFNNAGSHKMDDAQPTTYGGPCQHAPQTIKISINGQSVTFRAKRQPYGSPIDPQAAAVNPSTMAESRPSTAQDNATTDGNTDAQRENYVDYEGEDNPDAHTDSFQGRARRPPVELLRFLLLHCEISDIQRHFDMSEAHLRDLRTMTLAQNNMLMNFVECNENRWARWVQKKRTKYGLSPLEQDAITEEWLRQYPGEYKIQLDGTFLDHNDRPVPRELYPYLTRFYRDGLARSTMECPSHSEGFSSDDSSLSDYSDDGERDRNYNQAEYAHDPASTKWTAIENKTVEGFFVTGYAPSRRRRLTMIVPPTYYIPNEAILDRTLRETISRLGKPPPNNQLCHLTDCIPMFCTTTTNLEHIGSTAKFTCPWSERLQPWHTSLRLTDGRHFHKCKGKIMTLDELLDHMKQTADEPHRCAAIFLEKLYKENTHRLDPDDVQTDADASSSKSSYYIF